MGVVERERERARERRGDTVSSPLPVVLNVVPSSET